MKAGLHHYLSRPDLERKRLATVVARIELFAIGLQIARVCTHQAYHVKPLHASSACSVDVGVGGMGGAQKLSRQEAWIVATHSEP